MLKSLCYIFIREMCDGLPASAKVFVVLFVNAVLLMGLGISAC